MNNQLGARSKIMRNRSPIPSRRRIQVESERNGRVQREQELILSAIKRPIGLINTICPVITNIGTNIQFLHRPPVNFKSFCRLPIHAQGDCVIIGGGRGGSKSARKTGSGVIGGGNHPEWRGDTKTIPVVEPFSTHPYGQILQKVIIQMRVDAIPFGIPG